jgi:hypothetical protein
MALRDLNIQPIHESTNESVDVEEVTNNDEDMVLSRRSIASEERILQPRVDALDNSLIEHINSSIPSLDELIIRQRGRKKQPAKINWSPIKSPFKTPTKRFSSTLHMSLLSPSPKKLFNNSVNNNNGSPTPMVLRNSPRKRIFNDDDPVSSTPVTTPSKRARYGDERSINIKYSEVPLKALLKGLSHDQLVAIIAETAAKDAVIEKNIRDNLPLADIKPLEEELCMLRKIITKSIPRSRLSIQSKTDSSAFSRASANLILFKK